MNTIIKYCLVLQLFSNVGLAIDLFEESAGEGANSDFIQVFEYYKENPILLRYARTSDLSSLPFISIELANELINIRNEKKFTDVDSILNSISIDENERFILENCTIWDSDKSMKADARIRVIDRFQKTKGFRQESFAGSALDLFSRARVSYSNFEINLAQNKNAGENDLLQAKRYSFAYISPKTKIIFGDQQIKRGLGLALSNGFSQRKSPLATPNILSIGNGVLPSRSIFEFSRFNGLGLQREFNFRNFIFEPIFFYYKTPRPATLNDEGFISSLYQTGLFRTDNEIEKIDALEEQILGAGLQIAYLDIYTIGFTSYRYAFNENVQTQSFGFFNGSEGQIYSGYFLINKESFQLGGELAYDVNSNLGGIGTVSLHPEDYIDMLISIRYLEPELRLQYSDILRESSTPSNEKGLYLGVKVKNGRIVNNSYFDLFSSIEPLNNFFQEDGYEIMNDLVGKFNKGFFNVRARYENKSFLTTNEQGTEYLNSHRTRSSLRLELKNELTKKTKLRLRTEYAYINFFGDFNDEDGILAFAELEHKFDFNLRTGFRYTFYNTESFESAIWHFEYLVPGYMISPPLYNQGNKILAFLNYKISNFSFWLRYTRDFRASAETLGSGLEELTVNYDERFYIQMDFKFR